MDAESKPKVVDEEKICRRCGRCCVRKELVNGKTVFTKDPCSHLMKDEHGRTTCKIYPDRLHKIVDAGGKPVRCLLALESYNQGLLPKDCPYVHFYQKGMDAQLESFLMFQEACETGNWDGIIPKPKKNHGPCYGRGHKGKDIITQTYVKCSCLNR